MKDKINIERIRAQIEQSERERTAPPTEELSDEEFFDALAPKDEGGPLPATETPVGTQVPFLPDDIRVPRSAIDPITGTMPVQSYQGDGLLDRARQFLVERAAYTQQNPMSAGIDAIPGIGGARAALGLGVQLFTDPRSGGSERGFNPQAAFLGGGQTASFEFADELGAAIGTGETEGARYEEHRDLARDLVGRSEAASPGSARLGRLAATGAQVAALPTALAARGVQALPALGRAAIGATEAAAFGGAHGAGVSTAEDAGGVAMDALGSAGYSAPLGALGGLLSAARAPASRMDPLEARLAQMGLTTKAQRESLERVPGGAREVVRRARDEGVLTPLGAPAETAQRARAAQETYDDAIGAAIDPIAESGGTANLQAIVSRLEELSERALNAGDDLLSSAALGRAQALMERHGSRLAGFQPVPVGTVQGIRQYWGPKGKWSAAQGAASSPADVAKEIHRGTTAALDEAVSTYGGPAAQQAYGRARSGSSVMRRVGDIAQDRANVLARQRDVGASEQAGMIMGVASDPTGGVLSQATRAATVGIMQRIFKSREKALKATTIELVQAALGVSPGSLGPNAPRLIQVLERNPTAGAAMLFQLQSEDPQFRSAVAELEAARDEYAESGSDESTGAGVETMPELAPDEEEFWRSLEPTQEMTQ